MRAYLPQLLRRVQAVAWCSAAVQLRAAIRARYLWQPGIQRLDARALLHLMLAQVVPVMAGTSRPLLERRWELDSPVARRWFAEGAAEPTVAACKSGELQEALEVVVLCRCSVAVVRPMATLPQ